jgi:hypothetical protein
MPFLRHPEKPRRRKAIVIHCPSATPGPPYEVLGTDGKPLALFEALSDAETFAKLEADRTGVTVVFSPLARGFM